MKLEKDNLEFYLNLHEKENAIYTKMKLFVNIFVKQNKMLVTE